MENQKWISVTKELPQQNDVVLIYTPSVVRIGYLFESRWHYYQNMGELDKPCWSDVTHWQPLPEPPK